MFVSSKIDGINRMWYTNLPNYQTNWFKDVINSIHLSKIIENLLKSKNIALSIYCDKHEPRIRNKDVTYGVTRI